MLTLPHDLAAERALLGQCLVEPELLLGLADRLSPRHFFRPDHAALYSWLQARRRAGEGIDLVTLPQELERQGVAERVGGLVYVLQLPDATPSTANVEAYCAVVLSTWRQREVMRIAEVIQRRTPGMTSAELEQDVGALTREILGVIGDSLERRAVRYGDDAYHEALHALYDRTEQRMAGGAAPGRSFGHPKLDELTGGARAGHLVVLGARPSVGKTLLAHQFGHRWARDGARVLYFQTEMTPEQMIERAVTFEGGHRRTPYDGDVRPVALQVRDGFDTWEIAEGVVERARAATQDLPFWIMPASGLSVAACADYARSMAAREGVDVVIFDYLQRFAPGDPRASRERVIAEASQASKDLANDLKIPVVLLSQLNRSADGVVPHLSHLRESGAIEQDADTVLLAYNPDLWADAPTKEHRLWIHCCKARHGQPGHASYYKEPETLVLDAILEDDEGTPAG